MPTATTPEPLTDRQREIFTYLWEHTCREGYQPSVREFLEHFGLHGHKAIVDHLRALERKGWIRNSGYKSRALRFVRTPDGREFRGFRPIED